MNYYEILGIDSGASTDVIERAFRAAARRVHPDLSPGDQARAEARMKQLNEIRDTLTDPLLRAAYDERLRREEPRPAAPPPAARAPATASGGAVDGAAPDDGVARAMRPAEGRGGRLALVSLGFALVASAVVVSIPSVHRASGDGPAPAASGAPPNPPSTLASPAAPAPPPARPPRGPRRRGVVRVGSTVDAVVRAFGAPDSVETGARAGDATFHYGRLRLEIENGRVTGGDAAGR
jgi:DnaJ domain